jgi:hypothetical protein
MKYKLGSSPNAPIEVNRTWYPCVTIHPKGKNIPKVGEKIEADIMGEVSNVRKDPDTGEITVEISLMSIDTEFTSPMEKAGY